MIRTMMILFLVAPLLSAQEKWPPVVEVELRGSMTPFPAEGKWHLAYEIHITNLERKQVKLTQVEITGLPPLTPETLGPNLYHLGTSKPSDPTLLPAGKRAVLFIWITTDKRPENLEHRVTFENETPVTFAICFAIRSQLIITELPIISVSKCTVKKDNSSTPLPTARRNHLISKPDLHSL